jgi:hypothetical protein
LIVVIELAYALLDHGDELSPKDAHELISDKLAGDESIDLSWFNPNWITNVSRWKAEGSNVQRIKERLRFQFRQDSVKALSYVQRKLMEDLIRHPEKIAAISAAKQIELLNKTTELNLRIQGELDPHEKTKFEDLQEMLRLVEGKAIGKRKVTLELEEIGYGAPLLESGGSTEAGKDIAGDAGTVVHDEVAAGLRDIPTSSEVVEGFTKE